MEGGTIIISSGEIITTAANNEQITKNVTQTSSAATFSQEVKSIVIQNVGSNEVFINFDGAALITHFKLEAGETLTLDVTVTAVHVICSSGETTTVNIIGLY